MDEFVAMLERASAPMPDGLVERVLTNLTIELAASHAVSEEVSDAGSTTVVLTPERTWLRRRRHRGWAAIAVMISAAAAVAVILVTSRSPQAHPASIVRVLDPGRLPARLVLGDTKFTMTWIPPGFSPIAATDRSVTLSAPGWPDIVVSAASGETDIVAPFVGLGPLTNAHYAAAAALMQWDTSGSTITIHAASPVRPALLGRLAVGIVATDTLAYPPASSRAVTVPDVVGLDYRDAQTKLAAAGFAVRLGISSTIGTNVGAVESARPAARTATTQGSTVELGVAGPSRTAHGPEFYYLASGDLPDAVGYLAFLQQPLGDGFYGGAEPMPIVFLYGELVGYVGGSFEPLARAAAATEPAPVLPPETTATSSPATATTNPSIPP